MKGTLKRLAVPISFLIVLPIAMTLVLGFEFQAQVIKNVPFGIVDQDNSSLSRTLVKNIKTSDTFHVVFEGDSNDDILKEIENNSISAGIVIPSNFSSDVTAGDSPNILVIYDGCQMSMAGISKSKVSEMLSTIRLGASLQIMEAKLNISETEAMMYVQPISSQMRILGNPWKTSGYFFIPGLTANMVQLAVYMLIIEAVQREKPSLPCPLRYTFPVGALGTAVMLAIVFILNNVFGFPMEGSYLTLVVLSTLYMIGIANLAGIFRLLFPEKFAAIEMSMLIMATLLLAGYTYPILAMPKFYQLIWNFVPFTHFCVPLRDVMLLGRTFDSVLPDTVFLIEFVLLGSFLLFFLWKKHDRKANKFRSQNSLDFLKGRCEKC